MGFINKRRVLSKPEVESVRKPVVEVQAPVSARGMMTEAEAMAAVKKARQAMDTAGQVLLDLHDRQGWKALGYRSWSACVEAEFEQSKTYLFAQLAAERVREQLVESATDEESAIAYRQLSESQARPLTKLPADQRKAAVDEAIAAAGEKPLTAKHVKAAAEKRRAPKADPRADGLGGVPGELKGSATPWENSSPSPVADILAVRDSVNAMTFGQVVPAGSALSTIPVVLYEAMRTQERSLRSAVANGTGASFLVSLTLEQAKALLGLLDGG